MMQDGNGTLTGHTVMAKSQEKPVIETKSIFFKKKTKIKVTKKTKNFHIIIFKKSASDNCSMKRQTNVTESDVGKWPHGINRK